MQKKKLLSNAFIIIGLLIGNCYANSTEGTKKAVLKSGQGLPTPNLGAPYESLRRNVVSSASCLNLHDSLSQVALSNPVMRVNLSRSSSNKEVADALSIGARVDYGIGPFTVSAEGKYAGTSEGSSLQKDIFYMVDYSAVAQIPESFYQKDDLASKLLADYIPIYNDSLNKALSPVEQTRFRELCGDSFVSQVNVGLLLIIKLSLNFSSVTDKSNFEAKVGADIGIASVSGAIKSAAASSNSHATLTLSAMQLGGKPEQLATIFGKSESSSKYSILECGDVNGDTAKEDHCENVIRDLISYGNGFVNQIAINSETFRTEPQKFFLSHPKSDRYSKIGLGSNIGVNAKLESDLQQFNQQYKQAQSQLSFLKLYWTSFTSYMGALNNSLFKNSIAKLERQVNDIYLDGSLIKSCYNHYPSSDCASKLISAQNHLTFSENSLEPRAVKLFKYITNNNYSVNKLYDYSASQCDLYALAEDRAIISCLKDENSRFLRFKFEQVGNELSINDLSYSNHKTAKIEYLLANDNKEIKLLPLNNSAYLVESGVMVKVDGQAVEAASKLSFIRKNAYLGLFN